MNQIILEIEDLHTYFFTFRGVLKAVDGVSLRLSEREVLGVVGETGCGKSVMATSVMKLVPLPGKIVRGEIIFNGENLIHKTEDEMREIRGRKISMVFQNPLSSLNPVFTIGDQVCHIIRIHQKCGKDEALERTMNIFEKVRLPDPKKVLGKYSHELSGGMLQRVMISMALSCEPQILIADEPTTALDVTIQAQILSLMDDLRSQMNTSILLITHDLGVIAEMCDRVMVMYAGKVMENGSVQDVLRTPLHPYTSALMRAIPEKARRGGILETIEGVVPDLISRTEGCSFHPRCQYRMDKCEELTPCLEEKQEGHFVACHK